MNPQNKKLIIINKKSFNRYNLDDNKRKQSNAELMRYASLGTQFLVAIGLGIFFGLKLDSWLNISFPLLVWLFPLLIIVGMIIKLIIETSKK